MKIIKKWMHCICVLVAGVLWSALLALIFQQSFLLLSNINLFAPKTYKMFVAYWNNGGVLHAKELLMLFSLLLYLPLCGFGWYKLYKYKFMQLLTVPLNWLVNRGIDDYQAPDVNIKNLKLEEKKTLDQIVKERLEAEKKKNQTAAPTGDIRKKIVEQIEESKK